MGVFQRINILLFASILFLTRATPSRRAYYGTTSKPAISLDGYICAKNGRFQNPTDPNKYITCTFDGYGGGYLKESGSCPRKAVYNQRLDACVIALRTTTATPDTATSSTANPASYVDSTSPFVCTDAGRFPDPTTCRSYYMCYKGANGLMYGPYKYNCSPTTQFSPTDKRCTYASFAGCTIGS